MMHNKCLQLSNHPVHSKPYTGLAVCYMNQVAPSHRISHGDCWVQQRVIKHESIFLAFYFPWWPLNSMYYGTCSFIRSYMSQFNPIPILMPYLSKSLVLTLYLGIDFQPTSVHISHFSWVSHIPNRTVSLCVCTHTFLITDGSVTVAAPSKTWNIFACSNAGIVDSNPTQAMDICLRLFCVYVR
jgi:hypothetical protein